MVNELWTQHMHQFIFTLLKVETTTLQIALVCYLWTAHIMTKSCNLYTKFFKLKYEKLRER